MFYDTGICKVPSLYVSVVFLPSAKTFSLANAFSYLSLYKFIKSGSPFIYVYASTKEPYNRALDALVDNQVESLSEPAVIEVGL